MNVIVSFNKDNEVAGRNLLSSSLLSLKYKQITPYPAYVDNMAAPTNTSKWRMGFNSEFKGLGHTQL